jgi:hypothetical protein
VSEGQPAGQSAVASAWRWLIGPPLRAREVSKERITPVEGLPALSLDALTSVAYGPEAIIVVLIPVVLPDKLRYEFLHNHYDLVLSAALRGHPDVVCARVSMPLELADGEDPTGSR